MTEEKIIPQPPITLTYDQKKKIYENFKFSTIHQLKNKGYKVFKLSRSRFDYLLLKNHERIFILFNHSFFPQNFDIDKLKRFCKRFDVKIWIITDKGINEISNNEKSLETFQEHGKSYLTLKCYVCGKRTRFYLTEEMICPHCGHIYKFKCLDCEKEFDPHESDYCGKCGWMICPFCGCCGCDVREALRIVRERKKKHLAIYHMMHVESMDVEILTNRGLVVLKM